MSSKCVVEKRKRQRSREVHVLWREAELKRKGGEEQADVGGRLTTQGHGSVQARATLGATSGSVALL